MKNINITTVAIALVIGFVAYKVLSPKEEDKKSNFSSACGCEG